MGITLQFERCPRVLESGQEGTISWLGGSPVLGSTWSHTLMATGCTGLGGEAAVAPATALCTLVSAGHLLCVQRLHQRRLLRVDSCSTPAPKKVAASGGWRGTASCVLRGPNA